MRLSMLITALMMTASLQAISQPAAVSTTRADKLYSLGKYKEALAAYQQAAQEHPNDAVLAYNVGNASFRAGDPAQAEKAFDRSFALTADSAMKQRAIYNKGVALSQQKKLDESIAAYKSALLLNPADSDARVNLQKALTELKASQPPPPPNQDKKKNKDPRNQPPQSRLNRKQVDQLLKALDQHEQEVQQRMMENRARGVTKPEKDW